jgi:hypothetical protein
MATIGNSFLGLADIYKGKTKTGQVADIINMLRQTNSILDDAITRECNEGKQHKHTILSGLPPVTWGKLYQGIPNGKAQRTQVTDTTGFVEGRSTVDARLAEIEPNLGAFRLQEAQSYLEAMSQEMARAIIYENQDSNPEKITGLAPRFNSLTAETGSQIIDAGGTGSDNTSIWFVTWGMDSTCLLYPKGSNAGLAREDHGKQRVLDDDGNAYYALEETFRWHCGVTVRDWRKIVRIANLDTSVIAADPTDVDGSGNDLYHFMRKAYYQIHGIRTVDSGTNTPGNGMDGNFGMGRTVVYCNKDMFEALDALGVNAGGSDNFVRLRPREIEGKEVMTYRGVPIRQVDQIVGTESRIT